MSSSTEVTIARQSKSWSPTSLAAMQFVAGGCAGIILPSLNENRSRWFICSHDNVQDIGQFRPTTNKIPQGEYKQKQY